MDSSEQIQAKGHHLPYDLYRAIDRYNIQYFLFIIYGNISEEHADSQYLTKWPKNCCWIVDKRLIDFSESIEQFNVYWLIQSNEIDMN